MLCALHTDPVGCMSCYWRTVIGEPVRGVSWSQSLAWSGGGAFQVVSCFGDVFVELHVQDCATWLWRHDVFMRAEVGAVPSSVRLHLPSCNPSVREQRFRRRLARANRR